MVYEKRPKKWVVILIIIAIFGVGVAVGFFLGRGPSKNQEGGTCQAGDKKEPEAPPEPEKPAEPQKPEDQEPGRGGDGPKQPDENKPDQSMKAEIISNMSDQLYQKGYIKPDDVDYIRFDKLSKVGYIKAKSEEIYYYIGGTYKCKDKTPNCLRQMQYGQANSEGAYPFDLYFTAETVNNKLVFGDVFGADNFKSNPGFVSTPEEIK